MKATIEMTDPMLRNESWIIDRITVIAEYYLDVEVIQPHIKSHKPYIHNNKSDGWAPYIPDSFKTTSEKDKPLENL